MNHDRNEISTDSGQRHELVEPVGCPHDRVEGFWRSVCRCFSAHFPVTCVAVTVTVMAIQSEVLALLVGLACLVWWWGCLGQAVLVRSVPSGRRIVALLFVPVITCLSVFVGSVLAGMFCVFVGMLVLGS